MISKGSLSSGGEGLDLTGSGERGTAEKQLFWLAFLRSRLSALAL